MKKYRNAQLNREIELVGNSTHIQTIRKQCRVFAGLEIPVLITGESGTGKEIVANNIHYFSKRKDKPFIAINCASLSPLLIESELFGHAQGAFTGAVKTKYGIFEVVDGGTLFLDEIGELALSLQCKLLRILDNGEYTRVGDLETRKTDVRILSATNQNMEDMVQKQKFRCDLYYRLKGGRIFLEPLRRRREDIIPLLDIFLGDNYKIEPDAMKLIHLYEWPGNIRELIMFCASIKSECNNGVITRDSVIQTIGVRKKIRQFIGPYQESKNRVLQHFDHLYFSKLLKSTDGNYTRAAQYAKMDRKNLREKIKKAGLIL